MKRFQNKNNVKISSVIVFVCVALISFCVTCFIYNSIISVPAIRSDGHGYYIYLPAFFIYHDPKMLFISELEDVGSFATTYFLSPMGAMVDKYTMGTALLQLPFFLCAHAITLLTDATKATGFTRFYEIANIISAQVYYVIGCIFSVKIVKRYADEKFALISVLLCTFGSNLFHYITYDACFSHVYSFALIAIFIYLTMIISDKQETKNLGMLFVLGLVYGLIVLVRITDATVILFYVLYNIYSAESFKKRMLQVFSPLNAIIPIVGAVIAFLPQVIYWYITTGKLFLNSYGETDPGFVYLTSPQIGGVLFFVNQGIFFYCPLLLMATVGGIILRKKLQNVFVAISIFSLVFIYVIASWWSYILPGYSNRIFINIMPIFILFLAVSLEEVSKHKKGIRIIFYILIVVSVIWNLLCMYAYWHHKLKYDYNTMADIIKMLKWYIK